MLRVSAGTNKEMTETEKVAELRAGSRLTMQCQLFQLEKKEEDCIKVKLNSKVYYVYSLKWVFLGQSKTLPFVKININYHFRGMKITI